MTQELQARVMNTLMEGLSNSLGTEQIKELLRDTEEYTEEEIKEVMK